MHLLGLFLPFLWGCSLAVCALATLDFSQLVTVPWHICVGLLHNCSLCQAGVVFFFLLQFPSPLFHAAFPFDWLFAAHPNVFHVYVVKWAAFPDILSMLGLPNPYFQGSVLPLSWTYLTQNYCKCIIFMQD